MQLARARASRAPAIIHLNISLRIRQPSRAATIRPRSISRISMSTGPGEDLSIFLNRFQLFKLAPIRSGTVGPLTQLQNKAEAPPNPK